jgi:hypothetical protein
MQPSNIDAKPWPVETNTWLNLRVATPDEIPAFFGRWLQHSSGFHGENVQCALQFGYGFGELGMLSNSFSQGVQQFMGT